MIFAHFQTKGTFTWDKYNSKIVYRVIAISIRFQTVEMSNQVLNSSPQFICLKSGDRICLTTEIKRCVSGSLAPWLAQRSTTVSKSIVSMRYFSPSRVIRILDPLSLFLSSLNECQFLDGILFQEFKLSVFQNFCLSVCTCGGKT